MWSSVISWLLFALDLVMIGFLSLQAYRDGMHSLFLQYRVGKILMSGIVDNLAHYEVPFFGRLANSFVDSE